MNAVWEPWLAPGCAPARATVQAALAGPAYRVTYTDPPWIPGMTGVRFDGAGALRIWWSVLADEGDISNEDCVARLTVTP